MTKRRHPKTLRCVLQTFIVASVALDVPALAHEDDAPSGNRDPSQQGPATRDPSQQGPATRAPVAQTRAPLHYPDSERANPRDADVELLITVDATGHVSKVVVQKSDGEAFDAAAVRTIQQWHFSPAYRDGKATAVRIVVPVHFHAPHAAGEPGPQRHDAQGAHGGAHPHSSPEDDANNAHHNGSKHNADTHRDADHDHADHGAANHGSTDPDDTNQHDAGEAHHHHVDGPDDATMHPADDSSDPHAHAAPPRSSPAQDQSTVVQARAAAATAGAEVLDRATLDDVNRKSAEDLLRRAPGVHVVQHGTEGKAPQFYLRGFDAVHGSDIEVRLGRIPLGEPSHVHGHGYLDLAFIIPELVEAVDVQSGSFDMRQGPFATAASIRFSPGAAKPGLFVGAEGGWPARGRAVAILSSSRRRYIGVEGVSTVGFGEARTAQRASLNAAYDFSLLPGLTVDVGLLSSAGRFALPGAVRRDDVDAGRVSLLSSYAPGAGQSVRALAHAGGSFRFNLLSTTARADARAFLGVKQINLRENYTGYLASPDVGDEVRQVQSHVDAGAVLDGKWRVHRALSFYSVAEVRHVRGQQGAAEGDQGDAVSVPFDTTHVGASLMGKLTLSSWVKLTLGMRADAFGVSGGVGGVDATAQGAALSPRATLSVSSGVPGLRFFAALGRGVRAPGQSSDKSPGLFDVDVPGLKSGGVATAENGEMGVRYERDALKLTALAFGVFSADELRFDHVARTTKSAGASRRLGAQVRAAYAWRDWIDVSADITAVDARFIDPKAPLNVDTLTQGETVAGVPPLMAALRFAMTPWAPVRIGLNATALSPRPLRFGAFTQPVAVLNGSARYRWNQFTFHVAVDNILDARYAEGAGMFASDWKGTTPRSQIPVQHLYAGAPRMMRVGVSFDFGAPPASR